MKAYRISEILYVVIAIISVKEAIALWTVRPEKAYLFLGFAALAVFMYFFRSYYRKNLIGENPKWIYETVVFCFVWYFQRFSLEWKSLSYHQTVFSLR